MLFSPLPRLWGYVWHQWMALNGKHCREKEAEETGPCACKWGNEKPELNRNRSSAKSVGHLRNIFMKLISVSQPVLGLTQLWVLSEPWMTSFSGRQMPGCVWSMERALGNALPPPNYGTCARCGLFEGRLRLACDFLGYVKWLILDNIHNILTKPRDNRRKTDRKIPKTSS